jgi:hypothetical protein
MPNFQRVSLELISRGYSVIPVKPASKAPLVGSLSRTKSPDQIETWAGLYPDANVGIVSDDVITILETDDLAALASAVEKITGRSLPRTACLGSGRPNRCAFLFLRTFACGTDCLEVPGVFEFRNRNQYVLAPGSVHPNGSVYRWLDDTPAVAMPEWLMKALLELDASYAGKSGSGSSHVSTGPAVSLRNAYLRRLNPDDMLSLDLKIGENERHYTLLSVAGLLHDGERTPEEIAEVLSQIRDKFCSNPEEKSDVEVYRLAEYAAKREPFLAEPVELPQQYVIGTTVYATEEEYVRAKARLAESKYGMPRRAGTEFEYVLNPVNEYDGWFMRGLTHIIAGSSGAGKTTFMIDMLDSQRRGEGFFGHTTNGYSYLVIASDRGKFANKRTLRRMRIDPADVNIEFMPVVWGSGAVEVIRRLVEKHALPPVVFVEGADTLVEDASKAQVVAPFLSELNELAEFYHISIILSVGAGKMSKDYVHTRDKVFGSQIWPRMTDTMVFMSISETDRAERDALVEHRDDATEEFNLTFKGGAGRLVKRAPIVAHVDALTDWVDAQGEKWFTREQAAAGLAGVFGKTKCYERLNKMLANRELVETREDGRNVLRKNEAA